MTLITRLKEYNGELTVSQLPNDLQKEVVEWAMNFAEESFVSDDEKSNVVKETEESRVRDVVGIIENE